MPTTGRLPRSVALMADKDVWDVYSTLWGLERSTLNDTQRALVAVCDLRQEVNSGGFDAYFRYWGGNSAPDAVEALPSLLGQNWSDLLREAMDLSGPDYPTDVDTREERVNDRDTAGSNPWMPGTTTLSAGRTPTHDSTSTLLEPRRRWLRERCLAGVGRHAVRISRDARGSR
jgi:Domain of unknown function (DUF4375)